jgi:hypothetical protein
MLKEAKIFRVLTVMQKREKSGGKHSTPKPLRA